MQKPEISQTSTQVHEQAIAWLLKMHGQDLTDQDGSTFVTWLNQPGSTEAYYEVEQLYQDLQVVVDTPLFRAQLLPDNSKPAAHKSVLRYAFTTACAIAFALVVLTQFSRPLGQAWQNQFADIVTATGEIRETQLSDGSQLLLNTDSAVSLVFDDRQRRIILHHGQARFTVAAQQARPFSVSVGDLDVIALGTQFDIYKKADDAVEIVVQQHQVMASLSSDDLRPASSEKITEGQYLIYHPGQGLEKPLAQISNSGTAWQQHQLVVDGRPLSELIAELQRYRSGRIFLASSDIANLKVSGVFSLDKPDAVLDTVCKVLGLQRRQIGPWLIWLSH